MITELPRLANETTMFSEHEAQYFIPPLTLFNPRCLLESEEQSDPFDIQIWKDEMSLENIDEILINY